MSPKLRKRLEVLSLEIASYSNKTKAISEPISNINKILIAIRDIQYERSAKPALQRDEYDWAINDWTLRLFQEPDYYQKYYQDLGVVVYVNKLELLLEMDTRLAFKYKVIITMAKFCFSSIQLGTEYESTENLKTSKKHLESLEEQAIIGNEEHLSLLSQTEAKLQEKKHLGTGAEEQQIATLAFNLPELLNKEDPLEASMISTMMNPGNKFMTPLFDCSDLSSKSQPTKTGSWPQKLNL